MTDRGDKPLERVKDPTTSQTQ